MKNPEKNQVNPAERNHVNPDQREKAPHPNSTADRAHTDIEKMSKSHTIPNSGGQTANQTDNKQGNVNRGNQNPDKQGKKG